MPLHVYRVSAVDDLDSVFSLNCLQIKSLAAGTGFYILEKTTPRALETGLKS